MSDGKRPDELTEREDEATDKRTLDEIEADENVSGDSSDTPTLSPDQGAGRATDDNAGAPM